MIHRVLTVLVYRGRHQIVDKNYLYTTVADVYYYNVRMYLLSLSGKMQITGKSNKIG